MRISDTSSCSVFLPDVPAIVDARLQDNSQDQVIAGLRSLRLQDTDLPTRPGFGTVGTPIKLRANFFPIKVPKGPLFEYDVNITPPVSVKRVKRRIFQLAELTNDWGQANMRGTVAHDHSSKLIAARQLDQPLVITVPYSDEDGEQPAPARAQPKGGRKGGKPAGKAAEYTLTITFVQQLETESLLKYVTPDLFASHEDVHSTWGLQYPIPPKFRVLTNLRRLRFLTILCISSSHVGVLGRLFVLTLFLKPPRRQTTVPRVRYPAGGLGAEPHSCCAP